MAPRTSERTPSFRSRCVQRTKWCCQHAARTCTLSIIERLLAPHGMPGSASNLKRSGTTRARHSTTASICGLCSSVMRRWKSSARTWPSFLSCTMVWQRKAAVPPVRALLTITCSQLSRPTSPKQTPWLLPTAPTWFKICFVVSSPAVCCLSSFNCFVDT